MVNIPLGFLVIDAVQQLAIADRAQSRNGEHLGLTTGKHTGAVYAGQQSHFGSQRADFVHAAAVHALLLVQQPAAHHVFLGAVHTVVNEGFLVGIQGVKVLVHLFIYRDKALVPDILVVGIHSSLDVFQGEVLHRFHHLLRRGVAGIGELFLADFRLDALDEFDNVLVGLVAGDNAAVHHVIGNLVGAGLDHGDAGIGGGHRHCHLGALALFRIRIDDVFPVHIAHAHAGDGAVPRNIGDGKGNGGAHHGGNLRGAILVYGHDGADDGHVVAHILGEQGPDGPVNDAANQDGFLAGAAFPLQEGAGDFAHGIEFFLIVHGKGEEVDAVPGLFRGRDGHVYHGVAVAHQAGAVGKLGHFAGFYNQRPSGKFRFKNAVIFKHSAFLRFSGEDRRN